MKVTIMAALLLFAFALVLVTTTYVLMDPRQWASETQEVIIGGVVAEYCTPTKGSPDRYMGRTGAAATIAVKAGLGPLAYAEVLKCKLREKQ